jgi:hypothetical protein
MQPLQRGQKEGYAPVMSSTVGVMAAATPQPNLRKM